MLKDKATIKSLNERWARSALNLLEIFRNIIV